MHIRRLSKQPRSNKLLVITILLVVAFLIIVNRVLAREEQPSSSNMLRTSSTPQPNNFILMASHLRQNSDGELRLRIIEHNLHMILVPADRPLKSVMIFSFDDGISGKERDALHGMVENWRKDMDTAISSSISKVIFVPNDAVLVDTSKWMVALEQLLPEIRRTNARTMLINDSFLLRDDVPELWDVECGQVCGLAWTTPDSDPRRHIQSYIRTLSSSAVERYTEFFENHKGRVHTVHELIELFEVNLEWAKREGDGDASVSAIYDYTGAHPDADAAQKVLIHQGYPAIKLKKFFTTDDPWLSENDATRPRLPPSFSSAIYRRMNHDLNHLSDSDLENHFATAGKYEDRIYSSLPLEMKDWLKKELMLGREGHSTIRILEDYLAAVNSGIASTS